MSNNRDRRKALAKLIDAEFETIQVELDNLPELMKVDYKSLMVLNCDELIKIRKEIQSISRVVNNIKRSISNIQTKTYNTQTIMVEPSEDIKMYCSKIVLEELRNF